MGLQAIVQFLQSNILYSTLLMIVIGASWKYITRASAFSTKSKADLVNAVNKCVTKSRIIDSAIHLWSIGAKPFPWVSPPPANLQKAATPAAFIARAREAGVSGALIVQPANHLYDHSFVQKALKDHPAFFRGMCLANPTKPVDDAVSELEALHATGFVGVRFNAGNFPGGVAGDVGRALYKRAGELSMPVGVMAFKGLGPISADLKTLCDAYPSTKLIIDHLGFFRQPAIGGQLGDAATNEDLTWTELLALAAYPQVYVKVSALFRASGEVPPFTDLVPKLGQLLKAYGAERLMWGSDFPFVLPGGFPLPDGVTSTPAALSYDKAVRVIDEWALPGLDASAREALMGGTAAKLFGF